MGLQDALKAASEREALKQNELLRDRYIEFHASMYSSTSTYDNALILAGFAAFFALWAGTASDIPSFARLVTVALMGVSLMFYIAVTVGQMLLRQYKLEWKRGEAFDLSGDPAKFNAAWDQITTDFNIEQGRILRYCMPGFWLALGFGFAAAVLLTYTALGVAFGWPVLIGFEN